MRLRPKPHDGVLAVIIGLLFLSFVMYATGCRYPDEPVLDSLPETCVYRTHLDPDNPRRFVRDTTCY